MTLEYDTMTRLPSVSTEDFIADINERAAEGWRVAFVTLPFPSVHQVWLEREKAAAAEPRTPSRDSNNDEAFVRRPNEADIHFPTTKDALERFLTCVIRDQACSAWRAAERDGKAARRMIALYDPRGELR